MSKIHLKLQFVGPLEGGVRGTHSGSSIRLQLEMAGKYGSFISGQPRPAMRRSPNMTIAVSALAIIALAGVAMVAHSRGGAATVSPLLLRPSCSRLSELMSSGLRADAIRTGYKCSCM